MAPAASEALAAGIATRGHAIATDAVPPALVAALRARAARLLCDGRMVRAAVGKGAGRVLDDAIRGDAIAWADEFSPEPAERALQAWLEPLRDACNRDLMLGLFEFEGHYARYPAGASYARHRDRFADDDSRVLSVVLYLNARWRAADGGRLRLHLEDGGHTDVAPAAGTVVAFLSADFEHQVLPATRARWAFTGWWRRRSR